MGIWINRPPGDGITWTSRTSAADNQWFGVTYDNGLFVAVSYDGTGNYELDVVGNVNITGTYRFKPLGQKLKTNGRDMFPENTADTTSITGLSADINKWFGGVLAPNGKIYGIPLSSTSVLIIDPVTNTIDTTTITGFIGDNKWSGGVLAPNGKINGIPASSTSGRRSLLQ